MEYNVSAATDLVLQYAIYFMTYCILGWIFESSYTSLKTGRLINRGFCHGPWLPIYGTGATLLVLIAWPYRADALLIFLLGALGGTILELVTGFAMYRIFNMKWWDYTQNPLNFHGYICFGASIGWGIAALVVTYLIHPMVRQLSINWSYTHLLVVNSVLYTLFIEDLVFSVIGALDLKNRLKQFAENSEEIDLLRKNLSDIYEKLSDTTVEMKGRLSESAGSFKNGIQTIRTTASEDGKAAAARLVASTSADLLREQRQRLEQRLQILEEGGNGGEGRMRWWTRTIINNNPGAVSRNGILEKMRETLKNRRNRKEEKHAE